MLCSIHFATLWRCAFLLMLCLSSEAMAKNPQRLVSLSPNLTELVYALGLESHLVGRSSACDYPPDAKSIPVVGDFGRPNHEALLNARPDVVLLTDLENPGIRMQLERQGIHTMVLSCEGWTEMMDAARQMGLIFDQEAAANVWIAELEQRLAELNDRVNKAFSRHERPSVYVEIWGNPITTAGQNSMLHEVVELAGGRHIGSSLNGRYMAISTEWVVQADPEIIVLAYMLDGMRPAEALRRRMGWKNIRAVAQNRIIDDISPDVLLRPGPRLIDGAEGLALRILSHSRMQIHGR